MFSKINRYNNKRNILFILCILFAGSVADCTQSAIDKYGQSKGEPIDSGFFFHDDKYIESPYIVERKGLEILINGNKVGFIAEPYDWRIFEDPGNPPSGLQLPTAIPWTETEFYDGYWGLKYRYLRTNMDEEKANKAFLEIMSKMPSVAKIETDPQNSKHSIIYYTTGKTQIFDWKPEDFFMMPFPPITGTEELIKNAEEHRKYHEQRLKSNIFFFDRSKGGSMGMGAIQGLELIDVIISNESPEGRMEALAAKGPSRILSDPWKSQIENIRVTPQLVERAQNLREELKSKGLLREPVNSQQRAPGINLAEALDARALRLKQQEEKVYDSIDLDSLRKIPPEKIASMQIYRLEQKDGKLVKKNAGIAFGKDSRDEINAIMSLIKQPESKEHKAMQLGPDNRVLVINMVDGSSAEIRYSSLLNEPFLDFSSRKLKEALYSLSDETKKVSTMQIKSNSEIVVKYDHVHAVQRSGDTSDGRITIKLILNPEGNLVFSLKVKESGRIIVDGQKQIEYGKAVLFETLSGEDKYLAYLLPPE